MIKTTPSQAAEMLKEAKAAGSRLYRNEKAWTLLVADALDKSPDQAAMCRLLCGEVVNVPERLDVWFEAQPLSPRSGRAGNTEGNTRLDLAFGAIKTRGRTAAGIECCARDADSWVCFVEAKCLTDISTTVSYDPRRNQLTRVIENALCFVAETGSPSKVFVTLMTPRLFHEEHDEEAGRWSRLYGYKMAEYRTDRGLLRRDIEACPIDWRGQRLNLDMALERLHLNWVSFESILEPALGIENLEIASDRVSERVPMFAELVHKAALRIPTGGVS